MRGALQLDPTTDLLVAQMAPVRISQAWAGVLLSHQLSLLADYALGATPRRDATELQSFLMEFRADEIELTAADVVSAGSFRHTLDSALETWAPQASVIVERIPALERPVLLALSASVSGTQALSSTENELRRGVAITSLLIRYCERHNLDETACARLLKKLDDRLPAAAQRAAPN
ncbi:MAG TPA: hypothetical protein VGI92_02120 [Gemmatimonadales bacterium]